MKTNQKPLTQQFRTARLAGTPILSLATADSIAAVARLSACLRPETPMVQWDAINGYTEVNEAGGRVIATTLQKSGFDTDEVKDMTTALRAAQHLPEKKGSGAEGTTPGAVLFMHSAHEYLTDPEVAQAVMNLRDPYAGSVRTLVLLGPMFNVPQQIAQHVFALRDPMPTKEEIGQLVDRMVLKNNITLDEDGRRRAVDALTGLAAFPAEQALAMACDKKAGVVDYEQLWQGKVEMVNNTPGLRLYTGSETLDSVKGNTRAKWYAQKLIDGPQPPDIVVLIDEGEKGMDGSSGKQRDSSGVSAGMLGKLLTEFENNNWGGFINYGVAGTGKTMLAKAIAGTMRIPLVVMNIKDMQNSLVGQSEANLNHALEIIKAMSAGNPLWIMTSNDLSSIAAEFKARFDGIWMYDLPTIEELVQMWEQYVASFELGAEQADWRTVKFEGWVGREVKKACQIAKRTGMKLSEAATLVTPTSKSDPEKLVSIRRQAEGRFLSASEPGPYRAPKAQTTTEGAISRTTLLAQEHEV